MQASGRAKTEVFNTIASRLGSRLALPYKRLEKATCGHRFVFKYGEKNRRFQKFPATYGRGLRCK